MTTDKNKSVLWKVLTGIIVVINFGVGLWAYPKLPDQVPNHWNAAGQVDGYTNAFGGAFTIPFILLGLYILFWFLPIIDPKRENYRLMGKTYWMLGFFIFLVLTGINGIAIAQALEYIEPNMNSLPIVNILVGILFIVLGNYMGKIKYNYTFGIRLPWTLASEEVWNKTHRFSGPVMVVGGFGILITAFLPVVWRFWTCLGIILITIGIMTVYSYITYQKLSS